MNVKFQSKATSKEVIPAKAGIHKLLTSLDSRRSSPRTRYGAGVTDWKLLEGPVRIRDFWALDFI